MGNIQTMWDTGDDYQITPAMDGGTYQRFRDGICGGIGDEFALTYSSSSLSVQIADNNQCIIGGAFFRTTALNVIQLQPNATTYLCANIDKTRSNGSRGDFVQRTSSNMQTDNLNNSMGVSRDLLLYIITTNGSGVTAVDDKRVILGNENSISGYSISVLSEEDYEAITPDRNTIYYIFED
jgi:hypothetical protein